MIDKRKIDSTIKELDKSLYTSIQRRAYSLCDSGKIQVSKDPSYSVVCDYNVQPETIIDEAFSFAKEVLHTRVQAIWGTSFFNRLTPHEYFILTYLIEGVEIESVQGSGVQITLKDSFIEKPFDTYFAYLRDGIKTEISPLLTAYKSNTYDNDFSAGVSYMMESAIVEAVLLYLNARSGIITCDIRSVEAFAYALRVLEETFGVFKFVKLLNGEEVLRDIDFLYSGDYYTHQLELGELQKSLQGSDIIYDTRRLGKDGTDEAYAHLRDQNRGTARFLVCFEDDVKVLR